MNDDVPKTKTSLTTYSYLIERNYFLVHYPFLNENPWALIRKR